MWGRTLDPAHVLAGFWHVFPALNLHQFRGLLDYDEDDDARFSSTMGQPEVCICVKLGERLRNPNFDNEGWPISFTIPSPRTQSLIGFF